MSDERPQYNAEIGPYLLNAAVSMGEKLAKVLMVVGIGFLAATTAHAVDLPDVLVDPLLTRPPVLALGVTLPGDGAPLLCPAVADLTQLLAMGEAVDVALCNNPQLQSTWAAIKVQAAAVGEARAAYLPTLTGSVSQLHNRTWPSTFSTENATSTGHTVNAGLNWRLWDFGTRSANREAANQLMVAALAGHDATLQKVLNAVVGAYFDGLTAQAVLAARSQAAVLAQSTLVATQHREALGAAPVSDTLQASTAPDWHCDGPKGMRRKPCRCWSTPWACLRAR